MEKYLAGKTGDEIHALNLELTASKGEGNLIICVANIPVFREEIIKGLEQNFSPEKIYVKEGDGDKIIHKLRYEKPDKEKSNKILVWIMPDELSADIENALNNFRELFYEYPAPSVIFCNELFVSDIIKKAPDFWRYRGGFHVFKDEERIIAHAEKETPSVEFHFENKEDLLKRKKLNEDFLKITKYKDRKIELLLENASIEQIFGNFKNSIKICEKAMKIALEMGNKAQEAKCHRSLGVAYDSLGDSNKAVEYYEKSLKICLEIRDIAGEGRCYMGLCNAYYNLGDFKKAIEYSDKSLKIFLEIGDRAGEGKCYTNLGVAYDSLGDFKKAIEYHEKSLKICLETGDRAGEGKCYTNLGAAYDGLGDFKKAIEYYEKALKIALEIGNKAGESAGYTNSGMVYFGLGDFKKAIEYYLNAEKIFKEIGQEHYLKILYENMAITYEKMNNPEKADEYKKKVNELFKK